MAPDQPDDPPEPPDQPPAPTGRPPAGQPAPEGYAAGLAELDGILARLESDDADVDRLVDDVARASFLLSWCRARLSQAEIELERVTPPGAAPHDGPGDAGAAAGAPAP